MFNNKTKTDTPLQPATNGNGNGNSGATLVSAGTTLKGDINSKSDLRIDGNIIGNISSAAKIIIGSTGSVEGDIVCNNADIVGKVSGNVRVKELLQLRGQSVVTGNLFAGKLQVEPSATFNGQCHMGANVVEMANAEQPAVVAR